MMSRRQLFGTCIVFIFSCLCVQADTPKQIRVYFGTYNRPKVKGPKRQGPKGQGVYQSLLDLKSGKLSQPKLAGDAVRPGFLRVHPNGTHLYAAGELPGFSGKDASSVCAYTIDSATGMLTAVNAQPTGGGESCHVSIDPTGRYVLSTQYMGGSCTVFPISADGSLGEKVSFVQHVGGSGVNKERQLEAHPHSVNVDPSGRWALVADLGKDQVMVYGLDPDKGTLTPNDPPTIDAPAGSGPRHIVFHPTKPFVYLDMELTAQVMVLTYDVEHGTFTPLQTLSSLPDDFDGRKFLAEIKMTPDGRFLYVSNRGHDSIAMFRVDQQTGKLTAIGHESTRGKAPRHFNIDPTGNFLVAANQNSGNAVVFRIDQKTGKLTFTGSEVKVPKPMCVEFAIP